MNPGRLYRKLRVVGVTVGSAVVAGWFLLVEESLPVAALFGLTALLGVATVTGLVSDRFILRRNEDEL